MRDRGQPRQECSRSRAAMSPNVRRSFFLAVRDLFVHSVHVAHVGRDDNKYLTDGLLKRYILRDEHPIGRIRCEGGPTGLASTPCAEALKGVPPVRRGGGVRGPRGASSAGSCGWPSAWSTTPTRCATTRDGVKVGGHQASSASMVSIMTALYFEHLESRRPSFGEAACVAGPARHQLPLGPAGRALPHRAAGLRRPPELPQPDEGPRPRRFLDRVGRDRCDGINMERHRPALRDDPLRGHRPAGATSPSSATPSSMKDPCGKRWSTRWCRGLGEVLWIVDLNRQSLDRVVPGIAGATASGTCSPPRAGTRSLSSTAPACASCSPRTVASCSSAGSTP